MLQDDALAEQDTLGFPGRARGVVEVEPILFQIGTIKSQILHKGKTL